MRYIRQNATHKVIIGPFVDESDGKTPETGITLGAADEAEALRHDGATVVDISAYTWAAITNMDGHYNLTLQTGITDTVGHLRIVIQDDSVCLPVKEDFTVVEESVYDAFFASSADLHTAAISDIESSLVIVKSDLVIINSDTTAIHSDTTIIASDVVVLDAAVSDVESSLVIVKSDLVIVGSDAAAIHSDTTIIASDLVILDNAVSDVESSLVIIKSDLVVIDAAVSDVESSLVIVKSDLVVVESDTTAIHSDTTIIHSDTVVIESDTTYIEAGTPTAAQLAYITANASTGVPVTFTTSGGSTTAAVLNQVDGAGASSTDDQYNGRLLVFTNGTLKDVVTDITDYVGGTLTATITAIPFAPTASHTARLI